MTAKKTEPNFTVNITANVSGLLQFKMKRKLTVTCLLDLLERSTVQDLHSLGEEPIVFARELREKVEGLLKEIEKIKKSLNKSIQQAENEDIKHAKYDFWFALDIVKQIEEKIKKAFEGVME